MANLHPFDVALENYLLSDAQRKIIVQGDLGRVQLIKDIGVHDFKINLEKNNLVIMGTACQIISEDEEMILNFQMGDIKYHGIVYLKHVGKQVHLVHRQACVKLQRLKIQRGKWELAIQIKTPIKIKI